MRTLDPAQGMCDHSRMDTTTAHRETDPVAQTWARLIRLQRHRLGLGQQDLATHCGVSQAAVSRWEAGLTAPAAPRWPQLITLLELDEDAQQELWRALEG